MAAVASSLIAVAGLAISATTTGISIHQQNKARAAQGKAERVANEAMLEARKRLDVNYQEASSISKDPYTMAIEASLQQGANATQAVKETQRGAAQVGRIQGAQNQMLEAERVAYGQELQAREQRILDEDSRLRDINTQLDMGEIEGAQMAAAAEADNAAMAGQDIVAGVGNFAQQAASMAPLYAGKGASVRKGAMAGMEFSPDQFDAFGNAKVGMGAAGSTGFTNMDFASLGGMNNRQFRQFEKGLTASQLGQIKTNSQYQDALFPTSPALEFMLSQQK